MVKLTLIEGLPKYDQVNEAKVLSDALKIMMKSLDGRRSRHLHIIDKTANSKTAFMKYLASDTDFLHVSCHGDRINQKTYLYITNGAYVSAEDIAQIDIKAKVIFLNACTTSRKDLAEAFLEAGTPRYRYFIAPHIEVPFDEAFIVSLLFYRKAFLRKLDIRSKKQVFKALEYVYNLKDIKTNYFLWER